MAVPFQLQVYNLNLAHLNFHKKATILFKIMKVGFIYFSIADVKIQ